jgi:hypothetical protein
MPSAVPRLAVASNGGTLPPDEPPEVCMLLDPENPEHAVFLKAAEVRGSATFDEINAILPHEQTTSDEIEALMEYLASRGVAVIDGDDV